MEILEQIEVPEIICGVSSSLEILEIHEWITRMYKLDQETFGTRVISLDVEDVKTTFYDTLRMVGKLKISARSLVLCTRLSLRSFTDLERMHGDRFLERS